MQMLNPQKERLAMKTSEQAPAPVTAPWKAKKDIETPPTSNQIDEYIESFRKNPDLQAVISVLPITYASARGEDVRMAVLDALAALQSKREEPLRALLTGVMVLAKPTPEPEVATLVASSPDVLAHVLQSRTRIAAAATYVVIENALMKGQTTIIVDGDKTFPDVVDTVLNTYRKTGWTGANSIEYSPSKESKGAYRFTSPALARTQDLGTLAARRGFAEDSEEEPDALGSASVD